MRRQREILFNFSLAEKIQKHEIVFSNQRKKERKAKYLFSHRKDS